MRLDDFWIHRCFIFKPLLSPPSLVVRLSGRALHGSVRRLRPGPNPCELTAGRHHCAQHLQLLYFNVSEPSAEKTAASIGFCAILDVRGKVRGQHERGTL